MATKTTTKKKATTKTQEETPVAVEEVKAPAQKTYLFRFLATVSNLNIGNVVFSDKEVIIYSTTARNQQEAKNQFAVWVKGKMGNDQNNFNMFFRAVFGKTVTMEQVESGLTKRIKLPL